VLAVLELDPVLRSASPIRPVLAFRHQALKDHLAGGVKQIRPDLAQFERRDKDAVRPPRQQMGRIGLALRPCVVDIAWSSPFRRI
jgi:hypothetical protein